MAICGRVSRLLWQMDDSFWLTGWVAGHLWQGSGHLWQGVCPFVAEWATLLVAGWVAHSRQGGYYYCGIGWIKLKLTVHINILGTTIRPTDL